MTLHISDKQIGNHFSPSPNRQGVSKSEQQRLEVSFEIFPPQASDDPAKLWRTIDRLAPLEPNFMSVTYGAGGSSKERTLKVLEQIENRTDLPVAAHLTCVAATRSDVDAVARRYWDGGIRHVIALRGDRPQAQDITHKSGPQYAHAADLVAGLKRIADFDITVAAYPETHPEAISPMADLDNLKRKIDAGASRAITQFFFNNDDYYRFLERARSAGIDIPIIAGILPVTNFQTVKRFAQICKAHIPDWLANRFCGLDNDPAMRLLIGASIAAQQCQSLLQAGVNAFHFYTLNRADLTYATCRMLGLEPQNGAGCSPSSPSQPVKVTK